MMMGVVRDAERLPFDNIGCLLCTAHACFVFFRNTTACSFVAFKVGKYFEELFARKTGFNPFKLLVVPGEEPYSSVSLNQKDCIRECRSVI